LISQGKLPIIANIKKDYMFSIQVSNPISISILNNEDESIEDAIESIFTLDSEYAFIIWNHIFIPISYKCDVSVMINDIIIMVNEIEKNVTGTLEIHWPSNTFSAVWEMKNDPADIWIDATWNNTLGGLLEILRTRASVNLPKAVFCYEWKKIIAFIRERLSLAGYNEFNLKDFTNLNIT
jgi:hypothetical protein